MVPQSRHSQSEPVSPSQRHSRPNVRLLSKRPRTESPPNTIPNAQPDGHPALHHVLPDPSQAQLRGTLGLAGIRKSEVVRTRLSFARSASLVLVGARGSGLSSLAVIGSRALKYKVVDVDTWLVRSSCVTETDYIKSKGHVAYRQARIRALEAIMRQYPSGHILVCGSEVFEARGRLLLRGIAHTNPVIMINRDLSFISRYLGISSTEIPRVLQQTQDSLRQVSNVEFFNLTENEADDPSISQFLQSIRQRESVPSKLSLLQNVNRDFRRFLNALGMPGQQEHQGLLCPAQPEYRPYSCALVVNLEDVPPCGIDSCVLEMGADSIEISLSVGHSTALPITFRDQLSRCFQAVRRQSTLPIILHVEYGDDSLQAHHDQYLNSILASLRLVPDYVTVDLRLSDQVFIDLAKIVGTTRIIAHRRFRHRSGFRWKDAHSLFDRAVSLGSHVVRFINETQRSWDDQDCLQLQTEIYSRSSVPLIAVNEGISARASTVFNRFLTPVYYRSPSSSMLNPADLTSANFSCFIYQPLHFHIFGASVHYSLSPTMHNTGFAILALRHSYDVKETDRLEDLRGLIDDNFGGASISLPFKSQVLCLMDSMSEAARTIQAVNTLLPVRSEVRINGSLEPPPSKWHRHRAGTVTGLHGENTDWMALHICISRYLSPANAVNDRSTALVVGAGGMARASIYALMKLGVYNIFIWNRTYSKAVKVAEHFNGVTPAPYPALPPRNGSREPGKRVQVLPSLTCSWPKGLAQPTIIICTIPAHRIGDADPPKFTMPPQWFNSPSGGVLVELSYKLLWTPLLRQAEAKVDQGWICVEPIEVLIEQGCCQFELFTGSPAPRKRMIEATLEKYKTVLEAR
ncbi:hypothetical protein K461DRAFT_232573 [Myriangium duriaei CBS 260.36]|uniref:Quinate repressor protein n=1 Tax=Myriangium duriaei CBS 260.36 TaxID=1168546 RepID=A0A9P4IVE9_9PEZI|nr:hypothetical protein K461DRAFT_232573 [Myriangium duriaei CBS 260.36]